MKQQRKNKFFNVNEASQLPNPTHQPTSQEINKIDEKVYAKFVNFMKECRLQSLKQRINQFYGRNFAIKYKDNYRFKQQWEDYLKQDEKPFLDIIHDENLIFRLMYLFVMLSNTFVVWAISVLRVFRPKIDLDCLGEITVGLALVGRVFSIFLRIYSRCRLIEMTTGKIIIKAVLWDTIILLYCAFVRINVYYSSQFQMLLEILILFNLFLQAKKIYKQVKLMTISLHNQTKLKIADLMITSFIITHFGSLILFAATWSHEESSWIISAGIEDANYFTQYLYFFYFCSTTILTIGYGDMSPKNVNQVVVVTLIEFVGVIIFAYIINEIGHTMSLMRQSEEQLEKDMKTLRRLQKNYKIDESLIKRTKNYLTHHETVVDHLTAEDQQNLIGKLNQDLSSQLIFEKSLSVVKTSIFFLCRWTKEMQNNVANHLQKALFSPKEKLVQPADNQRIYLVKLGKIDIYIDRFGHSKKDYRRFLKSIHRNQNSQIGSNLYGYTAVISTKPCALDAVASDFSTTYFINKENFLKSVNRSKLDKEYYHQIKTKIDLSEFCQAYEAPSILNIREHFNPSRTILIRKDAIKLQRLFNRRESIVRNKRKSMKSHFEKLSEIKKLIRDKLLSNSIELQEGTLNLQYDQRDQYQKMEKRRSHEQEKQTQKTFTTLLIPSIEKSVGLLPQSQLLLYFQKSKEYTNYFHYCNLHQVLFSIGNENYNYKPKLSKTSSKRRYQQRTKSKKD